MWLLRVCAALCVTVCVCVCVSEVFFFPFFLSLACDVVDGIFFLFVLPCALLACCAVLCPTLPCARVMTHQRVHPRPTHADAAAPRALGLAYVFLSELQMDAKFLRNQRYAKKHNKKTVTA